MPYIYSSDAYSPREIAKRVEEVGVLKAKARFMETFMLGILAGGFIGLGGLLFTFVVATDPGYDVMSLRLLGGVLFASGYIIAILAGTEVFTSNNLLAMAAASRRITFRQLLHNWYIVLLANAVGALGPGFFSLPFQFLLPACPAPVARIFSSLATFHISLSGFSLGAESFVGVGLQVGEGALKKRPAHGFVTVHDGDLHFERQDFGIGFQGEQSQRDQRLEFIAVFHRLGVKLDGGLALLSGTSRAVGSRLAPIGGGAQKDLTDGFFSGHGSKNLDT